MSVVTSPSRQKSAKTAHVTETEFWEMFMDDVYGARKGGAIVFVDAENARKGVGKTSGAVALARLFSTAFGYQMTKDDLTLSAVEYLERYRDQPGEEQPSVIVIDEFVGAGAGDKRRAMAQQNLDLGRAWQLLRKKRVVTIATLPDWNQADKRLKKLADYRVWCREKPIGCFQPYKVTVPFNSQTGGVKTVGMNMEGEGARRIQFPNMDSKGCPLFRHISKRKDKLINHDDWDADALKENGDNQDPVDPDEVKRRQAIKYALRLYRPWTDETDISQSEVARTLLKDEYSASWVGNRVREWENGKHRDLVGGPAQ